jgi:hypothetical protein
VKVTVPVGLPPAVAEIVAESCGKSSWAVSIVASAGLMVTCSAWQPLSALLLLALEEV